MAKLRLFYDRRRCLFGGFKLGQSFLRRDVLDDLHLERHLASVLVLDLNFFVLVRVVEVMIRLILMLRI